MNVYKFEPTYRYSAGAVLVAAHNKEQAKKIFEDSDISTDLSEFSEPKQIHGLLWLQEAGIIEDFHFIE